MHIAQEIIKNIDTRTPDDVITLDYEGRFLRRKRLMTDSGEAFLVELPETISLSATDGFVLEDGRIIAIQPKPEPLLKLRTTICRVSPGISETGIPPVRLNRIIF